MSRLKRTALSPLARAVYALLRGRSSLDDPRITYAELAGHLREVGEEFEFVHHRGRELYSALNEVGRECRRLRLPPLPALVVRADTRRPGAAYYTARCPTGSSPTLAIAAWRRDLMDVQTTTYPALEG